jgi:hypothetical protein
VGVLVEDAPSRAADGVVDNDSVPSSYLTDRIITLGFVLAVLGVVVQTAAHLTNAFFLDYDIRNMDADADGNALAWASSVALFTASLGALFHSLFPSTPTRRLVAMGFVFAFFSVDEVAGIHEKIAYLAVHVIEVPGPGRVIWPLIYLPLFAFVVLSLWRLSATVPARVRNTIVLGVGLLVAAVFAEAMATLWDSNDRPLVDDLEIAIEEGAELAGWILIATAFAASAVNRLPAAGGHLLQRADVEPQ